MKAWSDLNLLPNFSLKYLLPHVECIFASTRDITIATVDSTHNGWVVVGELGRHLGRRDEGELGLLEHAVVVVAVDGVIGVVIVGGGHDRRIWEFRVWELGET
ncbi:hypothetical protein Droror1_Dr00011548 [Drosera rotundifolia]